VISTYGQNALSGTWKAKVKHENNEKLHISFRFDSRDNENHRTGTSFKLKNLIGLSESQINSSNSSVSFKVIREAGTVNLVGTFNNE
jgi:hypothetical protein